MTLLFYFFLVATATPKLLVHDFSFQPDYTLYGTAANITIDCESRYSVVFNGTSPGPTLHLRENVTTWVRVYNGMADSNLTTHWHGLAQRTAPFSDGVPLVSQWPIPPGHYFDYEVRPEIGDAGTYFYHSHVDFQSISAHGALIVEEECGEPPYKYDEDLAVVLGDYYNKNDTQIIEGLLADPFKWSGETSALLLNGQSGHAGLDNASDASCAPLQLTVQPDTTYRFRWIGGAAISLVSLGIEDHNNLTIIEVDGAYTKEAYTNHIQVAPGQRFSLLFRTKTEAELQALNKTSFWIQYENRERPANVSGFALLNYNVSGLVVPQSLPSSPPLTLPRKTYDWLEYTLEPHASIPNTFPTTSTRTVTIQLNQVGIYKNGSFASTLQWAQNGDIWQDSKISTPYLISIYENGAASLPDYTAAVANGGWDPASLVFPAKVGEVLDIVWQSNSGPTGGWDIHPMHAHGGHYWDLGSGNGTYDAAANDAKLSARGHTPVKRDTTMLYRYAVSGVKDTTAGWRAWRIRVEDAGLWMMHCHILQHMVMGMQTVWSFGDAAQITSWVQPYVDGYLVYGGSAYGNDTYDPLVNHYYPENGGNGYGDGGVGGGGKCTGHQDP